MQYHMIKEEFMRREDNFIRIESKIELANSANTEIYSKLAEIESKFNDQCRLINTRVDQGNIGLEQVR